MGEKAKSTAQSVHVRCEPAYVDYINNLASTTGRTVARVFDDAIRSHVAMMGYPQPPTRIASRSAAQREHRPKCPPARTVDLDQTGAEHV